MLMAEGISGSGEKWKGKCMEGRNPRRLPGGSVPSVALEGRSLAMAGTRDGGYGWKRPTETGSSHVILAILTSGAFSSTHIGIFISSFNT